MDNQHRRIAGERELDQDEIDLVNLITENGDQLGAAIAAIEALPQTDKRAAVVAKTHLQTGLMWLRRSIARPESF
jgi:hypothetical protein